MYHTLSVRILAFIFFILSHTAYANRISPALETLVQKYPTQPNEPAEVLEKRIITHIDAKKNKTTTVYVAIRINDETAIDDYSQLNVQYNSYFEDVELNFAHVLTENGDLISIKDDAIQIKSSSSDNFYIDTKALAFSLPLTYAGSTIEFQYTLKQIQQKIRGQFFDIFSFHHWERKAGNQKYRADFIHFSENIIQTPPSVDIYFNTPKKFPIKYDKKQTQNHNIHTWSIRNAHSLAIESYLPPNFELAPFLDISTISSWKKISGWASNLIEPTITNNKAIEDIASNIKNNYQTKPEQIKAVFYYMQKHIRYVFAHVGRGGYKPHNAHEVLANGYGDCKDQTVLTIALLRALGIKAYPALVATTNMSEPSKKLPQIQFDHMITYIPQQLGSEELWVDTVGSDFLFPGINGQVNKRTALIIKKDVNRLTIINNPYNKTNLVEINIKVFPPESKKLTAEFQLNLTGNIESNIRSWLRYQEHKESKIKTLLLNLYPKANIENLHLNNFNDSKKEVTITGQFIFPLSEKYEHQPFGFGFNISRLANILSLLPQLEDPKDRVHPVFIDYDHIISSKISIKKPPGYIIDSSSSNNQERKNNAFNYHHIIHDNDSSVLVEQNLQLVSINEKIDKYEKTYNNIKASDDTYWQIILSYNKEKSDISSLKKAVSRKKGILSYINLVQLLIDTGEYKEALKESKKAIIEHPKNGNLFYLKGLAYSYLNNDVSAEEAFKKSEELGYEI